MSKINKQFDVIMLSNDTYQMDRRIYQQANSLADIGLRVCVLYFKHNLPVPKSLDNRVVFIDCSSKPKLGSYSRLKKKLSNNPLLVKIYQYFNSFTRPTLFHVPANILDSLSSKPVTVVAHDLPTLPLAFHLKSVINVNKIIFDAHEYFEEQLDSIFSNRYINKWRTVSKNLIPEVNALITVTHDIAKRMQRDLLLKDNFLILPNSHPYISNGELRSEKSIYDLYGIEHRKKIILCCGGITPGRNLEELIFAAKYLNQDAVVCFLGYGDEFYIKKLMKIIKTEKLDSRVKIGKAVLPDQVVQYISTASLGFISNRGDGSNNSEGCPNRLYEYIQARVPIFSFIHKGVSDVVENESIGVTCNWNSPYELASRLNETLCSMEQFKFECLDNAAKIHCWESHVKEYQELIKNDK